MPFNKDKCKVMHLGHNNRKIKYEMGGMKLDSTRKEKDLGIIFNEKLQVGKQYLKVSRTPLKRDTLPD